MIKIEKCPCCEREFKKFEEYPRVRVLALQRFEIPENLNFPYEDLEVYTGPKSNSMNLRPPKEVIDFFKTNKREKSFSYEGWDWKLESREARNFFKARKNLIGRIKSLFSQDIQDNANDWESGIYIRSNPDVKPVIKAYINSFLNGIESSIGKEIPVSQILRDFSKNRSWPGRIPNTGYDLAFNNFSDQENEFLLKYHGLYDAIKIDLEKSSGGSISSIEKIFRVGILEYEPRLNE